MADLTASVPSPSAALLGGEALLRAQPRSARDWIPLARSGLPALAIDAMVRQTRIAQTELAKALAIPERTLARRKREGVFFARRVGQADPIGAVSGAGCRGV